MESLTIGGLKREVERERRDHVCIYMCERVIVNFSEIRLNKQ